jgi:ABC-type iron transport system FetAB ATPase subunit
MAGKVLDMQQPGHADQAAVPRLSLRGLRSALAGPFDLALAAGGCLAVGGPSGSGKSLFLRMIADLDPNEGEVRLDGVSRATLSAPAWRRKVPYVGAESGWWRPTAAEHFAAADRGAARALAARLGVRADAMDDEVRRLSTGERQRLAIIRALVLNAPVLLLDEPTGPLDPETVGKVEAVLKERLAGGTAIVLVSHDPQQAARLGADRRLMRDRRLEPAR